MSFILVTNDDGADSPALLPLARAMAKLTPVRVVVPDGERSWIGKAISRWEDVVTRTETREGIELIRVSGSPADCANLGVHTLFDDRPELVVSGVNIGLNTGSAFFLSSAGDRSAHAGRGGLHKHRRRVASPRWFQPLLHGAEVESRNGSRSGGTQMLEELVEAWLGSTVVEAENL